MPNRILKESINESRGLTSCTFFAQDLYKRIITYADDYGRFNADQQIMLARLYPRELAVVDLYDLMDALVELTGVGKISFYTARPRKDVYGCFPNWAEHQRLRDSKRKLPDPTNTEVNDWYLRRFIPIDMKIAILERDAFKCQECGRHVGECDDAARFVKMGTGLFHIDHIVPCQQGGRATMENLRLTCAKCNLSRKRSFTFDEIVEFAASCGELRRDSAGCSLNPIQSNPNPNPNPKGNGETESADRPPTHTQPRFSPPSVDEVTAYCQERNNGIDAQRFVDFYAAKGWRVGNQPMKDWRACVRTWEGRSQDGATGKQNPAMGYAQRKYAADHFDSFFADLDNAGGDTHG